MNRIIRRRSGIERRVRSALLSYAALAVCASAVSYSQDSLSLQQAATRALAGNPALAADAPGLEAARAEAQASRAGFLPRLDFEQSYTAGNNPVYVFGTLLTQQKFTAANFALQSLNTPNTIDNLQTRLSLQQNLWDAGRTRSRITASDLGIEIVERENQDHVRNVLLEVLETYYGLALARDSLEAGRVSRESADALAGQARERVATGLAVEADLLRAQAHLAAARQQEIQAGGELENAAARLNRLMGEPLENPIGMTSPLAPLSAPVPEKSVLVDGQRRQRPDYLRLAAELQRAEAQLRLRHSEFLPTLGAFSIWELDKPSFQRSGGSNWTAGITLRWNVYSGGADAATLHAARLRVEQLRKQMAAMESAMALELQLEIVRTRTAAGQVQAALAAEQQSTESLRILRNRYTAGLASMTDLLSAESARTQSKAALSNAIYRHRVAFGRLESAAGILSPTSSSMAP